MAKHTTLILKLNKSEIDTEKQKLINKYTGCKYSDTAVEVPLQNGDIKLFVFQHIDLNILPKIPEGGYEEIVIDEVILKIEKVLKTLYNRIPEKKQNELKKLVNPVEQTPENIAPAAQDTGEFSNKVEEGNSTPSKDQDV